MTRTWQLVGSTRMTIGTITALTPAEAVRRWREQRGQTDPYFDKLYGKWSVVDNKILFE